MTASIHNGDTIPKEIEIFLNVGGKHFQTTSQTLHGQTRGRLCRLSEEDASYRPDKGYYFYDRDPDFFRLVIDYYRQGELHLNGIFCAKTVQSEMEFWGLSEDCIGDCCWRNYCQLVETCETSKFLVKQIGDVFAMQECPITSSKSVSQKIWRFMEDPRSSKAAKMWAVMYSVLVILSMCSYAVVTLPVFRIRASPPTVRNGSSSEQTASTTTEAGLASGNRGSADNTQLAHMSLRMVDLTCLCFFSLEFLLRFIVCPMKSQFFKCFNTYCDILYMIPGWAVNLPLFLGPAFWQTENKALLLTMLRLLSVFRVFRLLKIARYNRGFRVLAYAIKASSKELGLMAIFVAMGVLIFGFLVYTAEVRSNGAAFSSAFSGFWWALITMSTVGYGDLYPTTALGYIVGAMCALSGLVLIGMPIPIIASNFNLYYGFRDRNAKKSNAKSEPNPTTS